MTTHGVGSHASQFVGPSALDEPRAQCNLTDEGMIDPGVGTAPGVQAGQVFPLALKTRTGLAEVMGRDHQQQPGLRLFPRATQDLGELAACLTWFPLQDGKGGGGNVKTMQHEGMPAKPLPRLRPHRSFC